MEAIVGQVNEIVESLFSDYNYGKNETKTVMPYCKMSIEKYIFGKVFDLLFSLYNYKYKEMNECFEEKRSIIQQKYSIIQLLNMLESKEKYHLILNKSTFEEDLRKNLIKKPYTEAIKEINKCHLSSSPREKLKCIMMVHAMMKSEVIDFHKGEEELVCIDDELPVAIYVVGMSDV